MDMMRKNIRYLRKKNNLTIQKCANSIGVSRSYLSQFESGGSEMSFKNILKLRELFNISLDDLIFKDLELEEKRK